MYKRNVDARSFNHCCSEKKIIITYSEFVFVALGFQRAMRMGCIFMRGLSGSTVFFFFTLSHKRHDFRKKKILNKKCVSIFSTAFVRSIFYSKKKWANYDKKCTLSSCKVSVIPIIFKLDLNFLDGFSKNTPISHFMKIHPMGSELFHAYVQRTDRYDEANSRFPQICEQA
jgi:hypothetical protein